MEGVISYRPSIGKKKLLKVVERLDFDNMNQFIDYAVMTALSSKDDPRVRKLMADLAWAVYHHAPLRFRRPTPQEDREIRERLKKGKFVRMKPER
jgi:hypothetical protein